jgi:hypothetical protein
MKAITIHKADRLTSDQDVPSVTLTIDKSLPHAPGGMTFPEAENLFRSDAEDIRAALRSLPQGTKHQLLLLLLADATVFYRGP